MDFNEDYREGVIREDSQRLELLSIIGVARSDASTASEDIAAALKIFFDKFREVSREASK